VLAGGERLAHVARVGIVARGDDYRVDRPLTIEPPDRSRLLESALRAAQPASGEPCAASVTSARRRLQRGRRNRRA